MLKRHGEGAGWIEKLLEMELTRNALSPEDRALAQELAFGIVRWQGTLDWLIARKTAGRSQRPVLQILLRLGLYQIFWLDRIPDHAAVNESVRLAREMGFGSQSGFVNAVLRGCLREREMLERELEELKHSNPALGWSHPGWLCERWRERWGNEKHSALLTWNNKPASVFIRVNTLKTTPEKLAAQLEAEGVRFEPRTFDWVSGDLVFELKSHPALTSLPSFQQGLYYVQDPSTLLAVGTLAPQPGESVLDLCAAPGGKTTLIAQFMENQGAIVAREIEPSRRELIRQNCARLSVTCVQVADEPGPEKTGEKFDRILVDAPCSNTGVMRRRVDLRWRVQPAEIERLRRVQLELLNSAASELKPGGTLVYSTCSLEPEENSGVVKEFLEARKNFRLETERELIPFNDGVDGAYTAKLRES